MSLFSTLRTGVSGMNAQSNRISTVAENIQNASTTGYKRTSAEFSSLLLDAGNVGNYNSGAVETTLRRSVSEGGPTNFTTSDTDLAIAGSGFFLVGSASGGQYLTRAGNFVEDGATGNLVNAGGFKLLGYKLEPDGTLPAAPSLTEVEVGTSEVQSRPSSTLTLLGNLSAEQASVASKGKATSTVIMGITLSGTATPISPDESLPNGPAYSYKSSIDTYDESCALRPLDFYVTKISSNDYRLSFYKKSDAASFPAAPAFQFDYDASSHPASGANVAVRSGPGLNIGFGLIIPAIGASFNSVLVSQNGAPSSRANPDDYSAKTSVFVYDRIGSQKKVDIYFTKNPTGEWSIRLYDSADTASFPASPMAPETTIKFGGDGKLASPKILSISVANGQDLTIDLSSLTQLAGANSPSGIADGSPPTSSTGMAFEEDGTVYAVYSDGTRKAAFKVPLADVASPNNLTPRAGNVFTTSAESGDIQIGFAGQGGRGTLKAGALEQSNVDVSTELTTMIESQTVYTANSKVFMTGNELLETLMNLKR